MAIEPMEPGCHFATGRTSPAVSPGSSTPVFAPKPQPAHVLVQTLVAELLSELDGGDVGGLCERLGRRQRAVRVVVDDATG